MNAHISCRFSVVSLGERGCRLFLGDVICARAHLCSLKFNLCSLRVCWAEEECIIKVLSIAFGSLFIRVVY